jgi:hypothetical protein
MRAKKQIFNTGVRTTMTDFEVKDCTLLVRMSGLPPAVNLRELRDRIALCHPDVLYHHFCEPPLRSSFDYPDYRNDFAVWSKYHLGDEILAERLGIIDPYSCGSMEEIRASTIDILEERLSEVAIVPWVRKGHEFYFMQAITIVFDTGQRAAEPQALPPVIGRMSNGSIYFHFLEARRRLPERIDDFSAWLEGLEGDWSHYIKALRSIDFGFCSLTEIREELANALRPLNNFIEKERPL